MDHLRIRANYGRLAERARRKRAFLATGVLANDASTPTSATRAELVAWYFQQRLGGGIPADMDAYVTGLGFSGVEDFARALVLEFAYVNRAEQCNVDRTMDVDDVDRS